MTMLNKTTYATQLALHGAGANPAMRVYERRDAAVRSLAAEVAWSPKSFKRTYDLLMIACGLDDVWNV